MIRRIVLVVLGLFVPALSAGAAGDDGPERFEFTRSAMGDVARIVVCAPDEETARLAAAAAFVRIAELEAVMTDYRSDSELMRLCAAAPGSAVRISEDLFGVLSQAKLLAWRTRSAYDPTIGPVVALWREARRAGSLPDESAVRQAMALVGHDKLMLDASTRTAQLAADGMRLDLGGIGKGYAADAAARILEARGLASYLVALGGDIVVGEPPPGEAGWRVNLLGREGADVLLARAAVSTSGDRYQFVEVDGQRYSHIADPRTGIGLTHRTAVVVIAAEGGIADPMATALSVLGVEEGLALAERTAGVEALFVTTEGESTSERATAGFPALGGPVCEVRERPALNVPAEGFAALFDGRDLTGWRPVIADPPEAARMTDEERFAAFRAAVDAARQQWRVEEGVLHMRGGEAGWTSLRTDEELGNFELRLDWNIGPGGDSGIYLRDCPQVQIWDNSAGSGGLYNNQKGGASPRRVADRPVGEWNTFRIIMIGDEVTVYLNGELVADRVRLENYWDRKGPVPATGPIWLQAHGSPLWFRNVFVKRLDP